MKSFMEFFLKDILSDSLCLLKKGVFGSVLKKKITIAMREINHTCIRLTKDFTIEFHLNLFIPTSEIENFKFSTKKNIFRVFFIRSFLKIGC